LVNVKTPEPTLISAGIIGSGLGVKLEPAGSHETIINKKKY